MIKLRENRDRIRRIEIIIFSLLYLGSKQRKIDQVSDISLYSRRMEVAIKQEGQNKGECFVFRIALAFSLGLFLGVI
jgi:hypothetical protein